MSSTSETESYTDSDVESIDAEVSNSEREFLQERIAHYKRQGWAKPRRSPWSNSLVASEFGIWQRFCKKLPNRPDPEQKLRLCEAETFKAYLEWRAKEFRITKEKTVKIYWRRILSKYIDLAGHSMNSGTEIDIRNWIPTLKLDKSEKEKHAMGVQDLYVIGYVHWTMDWKPCHGRFRVEFWLLLLLGGGTSSRPGALVESASAKGSNKALWYEHITIMRIRDAKDHARTTTVTLVDLVHIKNSGAKARRKRFIFRLENIPAFCIVSHIIAIAIADDVFQHRYASAEEIFNLQIPAHKDSLKVPFKTGMEKRPIFRDIEKILGLAQVSDTKALPYSKYRNHFRWLGRLAGFEQPLELYQIRRGSGRKLNCALTPEERNQTMGHHGSTYQEFYMPDLIERDFQSIYFGTPAEDDLIQRVARMGISRDERAPTELTGDQKLELKDDPRLIELRVSRDRYRQRIKDQGYRPVGDAHGTRLFNKYEYYRRKFNCLLETLKRERLEQAIRDFHQEIDTHDIDCQLNGPTDLRIPARPILQYEFRERAVIAEMLGKSLTQFGEMQAATLRVKFIHHLTSYCRLQESRRRQKGGRAGMPVRIKTEDDYNAVGRDLCKSGDDGAIVARPSTPEFILEQAGNQNKGLVKEEEDEVVQLQIPMKFSGLVCLVCIGDERFSMDERTKPFAKKYTLQKHLDNHVVDGVFDDAFQCKHPHCLDWIDGHEHFMNHAAQVHGVQHAVRRC